MLEKIKTGLADLGAIYNGFPMKADWMQSGLEALKAYEEDLVHIPVLEDGKIRFTMAVSYYYADEDVLNIAWDMDYDVETVEEAKTALPEIAEAVHGENVTVEVREDAGKLIIEDMKVEYCVLDDKRQPIDWEVQPDAVDEEYAFEMVEAFLNAAVDTE